MYCDCQKRVCPSPTATESQKVVESSDKVGPSRVRRGSGAVPAGERQESTPDRSQGQKDTYTHTHHSLTHTSGLEPM